MGIDKGGDVPGGHGVMKKTISIDLRVSIDLDPEAWEANYGQEAKPSVIREEYREVIEEMLTKYIRDTGNEGKAVVR